MSIRIDKQGFYRDDKGRYASKADYEFQVNTEQAEKNIESLDNKIQAENSSLRDMQSELDKVQEKLNKVARELNKEGMWNRIGNTIKKVFAPFKKAFTYIKGIFGFLKKIASLTFGSLIKLFGLLWVWSKLGSVSGLNRLSQAGIGGGGTAGGSQAAMRTDEVFGTSHYKHLYDNIQNIANNPNNWGALSILGLSDVREQLGTQDPSKSVSMVMQTIADTIKGRYGGYQSAQAQPIVTSALGQLGLDFAGVRAWDESGIKDAQDKYFEQQNKNIDGLVKLEQAYRKLQFQFTDLWRHFAVSLGPVVLKLSPIFIKFGHRLASWLSSTEIVKNAFDSLYEVTKKVFEWLGTGGLDALRRAMEWVRGFYRETLKPFGEKIANWVKNNGGFNGVIEKLKDGLSSLWQVVLSVAKGIGLATVAILDNPIVKKMASWGDIDIQSMIDNAHLGLAHISKLQGNDLDYQKFMKLSSLAGRQQEELKQIMISNPAENELTKIDNDNQKSMWMRWIDNKKDEKNKQQEVNVTLGGTVMLQDSKGNITTMDVAKMIQDSNMNKGGQ